MKKTRHIEYGLIVLLMFFVAAVHIHANVVESFRIISIPKRESGYNNFESTVITTQDDLTTFLQHCSQGRGWSSFADFEKALALAKLDFNRESLVLLRHTESSSSVQIKFQHPIIKEKRIICRIDREVPEVGAALVAYYCFALAVPKADVSAVELQVSDGKQIVLSMRKEDASHKPDTGGGK